jgi:hypothetical protein
VDPVEFGGPQLAVLGAVLGPLLTAIGVLFRNVVSAKNEHIKSIDGSLREALVTNKELSTAVAEATRELRELRADLWREWRAGGHREGTP